VTDSEIFNVDDPVVTTRIEAELEIKNWQIEDFADEIVVSHSLKEKISNSSLKIIQRRCVIIYDEGEPVADNETISTEVFADLIFLSL
jgi:hypothetical protein